MAVTLALTIVIGVLSSILASQIMPQGVLTWSLLTQVSSFWILLLTSSGFVYLNICLLDYDKDIMRYADDAHCIAYIRKAKLEGMVALIRLDPAQAPLVDAKIILKNLGVK